VHFQAHDVGLDGPIVVYDYFARKLTLVPAAGAFNGELEGDDASFYISASPGKSGIAFLGDRDNFVGTGRMRIASINDSPGQLEATVLFAQGERGMTLHGYAGFEPQVTVHGGHAEDVQYDAATGEFNVAVSPDPTAPAASRSPWEPPVQEVRVVFGQRGRSPFMGL